MIKNALVGALAAGLLVMGTAPAAFATYPPDSEDVPSGSPTPTPVSSEVGETPPAEDGSVTETPSTEAVPGNGGIAESGDSLAVTGGDVAVIAGLGALAVVGGAVFVFGSRRRHSHV